MDKTLKIKKTLSVLGAAIIIATPLFANAADAKSTKATETTEVVTEIKEKAVKEAETDGEIMKKADISESENDSNQAKGNSAGSTDEKASDVVEKSTETDEDSIPVLTGAIDETIYEDIIVDDESAEEVSTVADENTVTEETTDIDIPQYLKDTYGEENVVIANRENLTKKEKKMVGWALFIVFIFIIFTYDMYCHYTRTGCNHIRDNKKKKK